MDGDGIAGLHGWYRPARLDPAVVEADADPLFICHIHRHLMAQPALPEQHVTGLRRHIDEVAQLGPHIGFAPRCRHHHRQARVLVFDGTRALGHGDIGGAADHAVRVQMRGMDPARLEDIDPERVQRDLLAREVKFQILDKGCDMLIERGDQILEDRKPPVEIGERGIAGIARIVVLLAPFLPGLVILGD